MATPCSVFCQKKPSRTGFCFFLFFSGTPFTVHIQDTGKVKRREGTAGGKKRHTTGSCCSNCCAFQVVFSFSSIIFCWHSLHTFVSISHKTKVWMRASNVTRANVTFNLQLLQSKKRPLSLPLGPFSSVCKTEVYLAPKSGGEPCG